MNAVVESKGEVIYVRETDANGKNPGKVYRLAQDDAIPVTLPNGSAGSFKDIKEGQHIEIWYLGHRVLWKNAWIPGVEEVELQRRLKKMYRIKKVICCVIVLGNIGEYASKCKRSITE